MSAEDMYRQCELRHDDGRVDVAFIPIALAKTGLRLKVRRPAGPRDPMGNQQGISWEHGWTVTALYEAKKLVDLGNVRHAQKELKDKLDPHQ